MPRAGSRWAERPATARGPSSPPTSSSRATKPSTGGWAPEPAGPASPLPRSPRGGRRDDPVHPKIDDQLAIVVARLKDRYRPEREAAHHAVPDGELHLLEELSVAERAELRLCDLELVLHERDDLGLGHALSMVVLRALGPAGGVAPALGDFGEMHELIAKRGHLGGGLEIVFRL